MTPVPLGGVTAPTAPAAHAAPTRHTTMPQLPKVGSSAAAGAAWVLLAFVSYRALGFLTNLVLARLLSPNEFGLVSFAMVVINASVLLQDVGVPAALIFSGRDIRSVAGTALTINVAVAAVLCAVVMASAPLLAQMAENSA